MKETTTMTFRIPAAATAIALAATAAGANPEVGGAPMLADKNIVENAVNSPIHTTLVAAVQQAGLVDTLRARGPSPSSRRPTAFAALPEGTVEALMMAENKDQLTQILTCHVVAADAMYGAIRGMIADDGGAHPVETVGGCELTARLDGNTIMLDRRAGQHRQRHRSPMSTSRTA
jgi:transforming growth factor-beta-induced protein